MKLSTSESIERFSPPIFSAFCSKNARMCIDRLAHYKKLIGPMRFEVTEMDDLLTVAFLAGNPEHELSGFVAESETPAVDSRVASQRLGADLGA